MRHQFNLKFTVSNDYTDERTPMNVRRMLTEFADILGAREYTVETRETEYEDGTIFDATFPGIKPQMARLAEERWDRFNSELFDGDAGYIWEKLDAHDERMFVSTIEN